LRIFEKNTEKHMA